MNPEAKQQPSERGVLNRIRAWGDSLMKAVTPLFRPPRDPLVADNQKIHRVDPLAASYAVGASVRHLQEREASFTSNQVLQNALNFAEQNARIGDIEARVAQLTDSGLLIAGGGKFAYRLTTPDMVRIERQILAAAKDGIGMAKTHVGLSKAAVLLDAAAESKLGFALNAEQRRAGAAIIASPDRYVAIQGGAGTGIDTRSLASFLAKFENLAGTRDQPNPIDAQPYAGSTLILDEASMVSNRQLLGLMQIAEKLEVNRIVMVGDSGQISAVEAGSPFRQMQEKALQTIQLDQNLRQRDGDMKEAVALLQAGFVDDAFDKLGSRVVESSDPVASAAKAWLSLDDRDRMDTAIFTSGHRLRTETLDTVRAALANEGKLGPTEHALPILQNLNLTREQMRSVNSYATGQVLDVFCDTAAIGLARGSYGVTRVDPKSREVTVQSGGGAHAFRPEQLHPNASGLSLSQFEEISVRTGDVLHWTASDKSQGIASGQMVKLTGIEDGALTFTDRKGREIELNAADPMAQRLDHALVLNMHKGQGMTVENAIAVMASGDHQLNSQSLAYVLASRARDGFELHIDSREAIIDQLEGNSGMRHSAVDIADSSNGMGAMARGGEQAAIDASEHIVPTDLTLETPEIEISRDFGIE